MQAWISEKTTERAAKPAARSGKWVGRAKPAVVAAGLAPALWLIWRGFHGTLGGNPVETITHATGDWTLRFLLLTLLVTPARELLHRPELVRFRRMLGLFAFFYGCLHFLTYMWLDKFFDVHDMLHDIGKRPFIKVGFTAFVLLVPLAVTSTAGWIRRLGGKRWRALHRLIYVSVSFGVVHYWWLVKSDIRKPLTYGAIAALLLGYRAWRLLPHKRLLPYKA